MFFIYMIISKKYVKVNKIQTFVVLVTTKIKFLERDTGTYEQQI